MKTKNIFFSVILLLSIALCFLHFIKNKNDTKIVNYMFLNIEALAQNEDGGNISCWRLGSLDCPFTNTKAGFIFYN